MHHQKWFAAAAASLGMLALILDSRAAFSGAAQGVELCIKTVIPSLFPFLYLSGVFSATLRGAKLSFLRLIGKAFLLPPQMDYLLIPAFLGGYPIGAQSVSDGYHSGFLGKNQAERMLGYCSNVGPAFLFGILSAHFHRKSLVWGIWGIQIVCAWTAARFLSGEHPIQTARFQAPSKTSGSQGIEPAIQAMLKICGWVVLFRVVIAFLDRWFLWAVSTPWRVTLIGILELSNGCCSLNLIESEGLRFVICNFLLCFGGLCVAYQTASVCPGLELRFYYLGKLLQGTTALVLSTAVYYRHWLVIPVWIAAVFLLTAGLQKKSRNSAPLGV